MLVVLPRASFAMMQINTSKYETSTVSDLGKFDSVTNESTEKDSNGCTQVCFDVFQYCPYLPRTYRLYHLIYTLEHNLSSSTATRLVQGKKREGERKRERERQREYNITDMM